jgi:3',5'-cyclic AMP phosphodiesterase CpdA
VADEPTTLVLRFRDLSKSVGYTIASHQRVIERAGRVWWGWWNKPGERVPEGLFGSFATRARADGLAVLLLDSFTGRVYRATCTDISYEAGGHLQRSPDPTRTPMYYRAGRYAAWFAFSAIAEASSDVLTTFTQVGVADFFEHEGSRFSRFYGTQLPADGLAQQERSIWFVRPSRVGDRRSPRPTENFPVDFVTTQSPRLVWVSDLHFSEAAGEHAFPLENTTSRAKLSDAIDRVLDRVTGTRTAGGLVVSGDLAFRAKRGEFDLASQFLEQFKQSSGAGPAESIVVPGNHDLAFSEDPAVKTNPIANTTTVARRQYADFFQGHFGEPASAHLAMGRRLLLGGVAPIEVVGLNSSALQQESKHFQGHGFLGAPQLDDVASAMGWVRLGSGPRPYRVVVLHHHVLPITSRLEPERDAAYSVVLDAGALMLWLADHRVDLVLHGHMHDFGIADVTHLDSESIPRRFTVVGLGSAGVTLPAGDGSQNQFATLDFGTGGGPRLEVFRVFPAAEGSRLRPAVELPLSRALPQI